MLIPDGAEIELRFATQTGPHPGAGPCDACGRLGGAEPASSRRARARPFAWRTAACGNVRREGDLIAVDWPVMPFVERRSGRCAGGVPRAAAGEDASSRTFGTIAVFASEEDVRELAPDLERIAALEANAVIVTAPARRSDFVIRVFAPKLGLAGGPGLRNGASDHRAVLGGAARQDLACLASALAADRRAVLRAAQRRGDDRRPRRAVPRRHPSAGGLNAMRFNLPPTGRLVTIREGGSELVVAPECGARLVSFRVDGRDVLRPASAEALETAVPYGFAGFPLMPYSGPIFGDGFRFAGGWHALARNVPAEPTATHGEGWIMAVAHRPRRMIAPSRSRSTTRRRRRAHFPFAWRGEMTFAARRRAADRRHEADQPRPPADAGRARLSSLFSEGAGNDAAVRLHRRLAADAPRRSAKAAGRSSRVSISAAVRTSAEWCSTAASKAGTEARRSRRRTASRRRSRPIPLFGKLQIYDAWDYPYICIEPVTNANDGFNRAALGVPGHSVAVLEPGRSLAGNVTIRAGLAGRKRVHDCKQRGVT